MKKRYVFSKSGENLQLELIIIFLCVFIIFPLLVIGVFNRPSADDFFYSIRTYQAVQAGGGFAEIIKAAWETDISFYHSWQGLYSSAFLLALQPGIFGEPLYAITTPTILFFAFICIFYSVRILNRHFFHYSKRFVTTASLFILTFISLWLPSPNQGLYWFNGAINYMPWAFTNLLNLCLLVEIYKTDSKNRAICLTVVVSVISFLTSGGNHVTSFANILFIFFSLFFVWTKGKRYYPIFPLISACVGFAIMYFAPGTAIRQEGLSQQTIPVTLFYTSLQFLGFFGSWFSLIYILSLVLMIPVAIRFSKENPSREPCVFPWLPLLLSAVVLCGMLSVPFYATGSFGEGRLTNVIWVTFVMLGWMNYLLIFRWVYEKDFIIFKKNKFSNNDLLKTIFPVVLIVLITIIGQNGTFSSSLQAMREIVEGTAIAYGEAMDARFDTIHCNSSPDISVNEIDAKSEILCFDDITTDSSDWKNLSMSEYYGKESIVIIPNENKDLEGTD